MYKHITYNSGSVTQRQTVILNRQKKEREHLYHRIHDQVYPITDQKCIENIEIEHCRFMLP